jgi:hypothetical protein
VALNLVLQVMLLKQAYMATPWFWLNLVIMAQGVLDFTVMVTVDHEQLMEDRDAGRRPESWLTALLCSRFLRQLHALEVSQRMPPGL